MNSKDIIVVVQGPIHQRTKELKNKFKNIIFSTWEGHKIDVDNKNQFLVNSKLPIDKGTRNINLQKISTINGIKLAKNIGYKYVLKWRSDFIPSDGEKIINLLKKDYLNLYSYLETSGGYYTDYFMSGKTEDIENIFSIDNIFPSFPEYAITNKIQNMNLKINFLLNNIDSNNDIFWITKNKKLSINLNEPNIYKNKVKL